MSIIKYNDNELILLAKLMKAEAIGEGELGMLMVGNVVVNRVLADCYTFRNIKTINDAIYQTPGGFAGIKSNLFFENVTDYYKNLARRVLNGECYYPATNALWFYNPGTSPCVKTWYNQQLVSKYKNHCFYQPDKDVCSTIY